MVPSPRRRSSRTEWIMPDGGTPRCGFMATQAPCSDLESGSNVIIGMTIGDGPLTATTVKQNGVDYAGWVDAKVRIHGNAGALSTSRHQMTGFRVMFPSRDEVKIEEPAPADPFALPVREHDAK